MKAFVIVPEITAFPMLKQVLGDRWLDQKVDAAIKAFSGKAGLSPSMQGQTLGRLSHPLVSEFYHVAIGADRDRLFGSPTPLADSVESALNELHKTNLTSDIGPRLKDSDGFLKVAYELEIAAGFKRLGHQISWSKPGPKMRPEFFLTSRQGSVSIECKKRNRWDGVNREGDRFWKQFQDALVQAMNQERLNFWIRLSGRRFQPSDADLVVAEVIDEIKTNENGRLEILDGRYVAEFQKLTDVGGSISREVVDLFPRGSYGVNSGKSPRNNPTGGPMRDPKLIRMIMEDEPDQRVRALVRNLKDASKQVADGLASLVYLDVNIPTYVQEQQEFEDFVRAVSNEMHGAHKSISAAILTNNYPALSVDGHMGWRIRSTYVAHESPGVVLPDDLVFPGDANGSQWLAGAWHLDI